jgi:hypothetical protein
MYPVVPVELAFAAVQFMCYAFTLVTILLGMVLAR